MGGYLEKPEGPEKELPKKGKRESSSRVICRWAGPGKHTGVGAFTQKGKGTRSCSSISSKQEKESKATITSLFFIGTLLPRRTVARQKECPASGEK
ncbi:hypothetical protein [Rufibacter ruber]|uniref:hypothetical protein n=1 Tax=Rufibacter ruber TaxID=1783499 RepID=UPI000830A696|nr:hypothetical protein [Rufibacter ruber]